MAQVDREPVTIKQVGPSPPRAQGRRQVNLGGGVLVPYPEPLNEAASKIGRANPRAGTKPEVRVRSAVHRRGLRFRKDLLLRVGSVRVRPDLVFTRWKVAVFIDGCFWHQCPDHGRVPTRNRAYWAPKLQANVERDRRVDALLSNEGWLLVRAWEHEDVDVVVDQIASVVADRTGTG